MLINIDYIFGIKMYETKNGKRFGAVLLKPAEVSCTCHS